MYRFHVESLTLGLTRVARATALAFVFGLAGYTSTARSQEPDPAAARLAAESTYGSLETVATFHGAMLPASPSPKTGASS